MAGIATGERIKGSVQRQIIQMAIEGHTINQIATAANVDWTTANVIVQRNSKPIQERKNELVDVCYRVAFQATEQLEDNLHKIAPAQLATVAGIMTDKVIALTQEPINQINQHLHVHLNPSNMMEQFNDLVGKINGNPAPDLPLSLPLVSSVESVQAKQKESEQVLE